MKSVEQWFALLLAFGCLPLPNLRSDEPHKLLETGRYQELIDDPEIAHDGQWAFARFYLLPDKETYQSAFEAHERGDLLGTFIVMRCHQEGAGVRADQKMRWLCNFKLRETLEKRSKLSAIESYMLSYVNQADATGTLDMSRFDSYEEGTKVAGKSDHEHLRASAEAGFAQAIVEEGERAQGDDNESAVASYRKAAELGLASGMKDLGFMLATGHAPEGKNDVEAMRWTREAAKRGDIYAMVNIAAFDERLEIAGTSQKEAQESLNRAVATGHYLGALEKGIALLAGNYGFEIDKSAGLALLQKGANSGHSFALGQLAYFYASGIGVDVDFKMAATLGKAAYLQGNESALKTIAACYEYDEDLAKDEAAKEYWQLKAVGKGLAFAMGRDEPRGAVLEELEKIDPFAIKLR